MNLFKRIFILMAVIMLPFKFFSFSTYAQTGWVWGAGNLGSGIDGYAVATDAAGNVYGAGVNYGSAAATFGAISVPNTATAGTAGGLGNIQSIWVKYSPTGTPLWADGTQNGDSWLYNITTDAGGNLIVFGSFESPTLTIGSITLTNAYGTSGDNQYFIAKYSPTGTLLWAIADGNSVNTYQFFLTGVCILTAGGVTTDAAGNIYITTSFMKPTISVSGTTLTNADPSGATYDILVAKYTSSGSFVWAKRAGGTSDDYGYGIAVSSTGNIYVTGPFWSPSITVGASTISNPYGSSIPLAYIAKFSPTGTPLWAQAAGGSTGAYAIGLAADLIGNVYLTGGYLDASISFGAVTVNKTYPSNPSLALFLVQYSSADVVTWHKTIGSPTQGVWGFCIGLAACGEVWVSGNYSEDADVDGHTLTLVPGTDPVFIAGYNLYGGVIGYAGLGSGGDDQNGIAVDPSGNVFICSDYQSSGSFSVGPSVLSTGTGSGEEYQYVGKFANIIGVHDTIRSSHDTTICGGAALTLSGTPGYSGYLWDNAATSMTRTVSTSGNYWVVSTSTCSVPTTIDTFHVHLGAGDTLHHSHDTVVCAGATITLNAPAGYTAYVWNNASTATSLTTSASGVFWVIGTNACPAPNEVDTFHVHIGGSDTTYASHDTTLCSGTLLTLNAPAGYSTYSWQNGTTSNTQSVSATGVYWVIASSPCPVPILVDTFHVNFGVVDTLHGHRDTTVCGAPSITLTATAGYTGYVWNNASTSNTNVVTSSGTYWVLATGPCPTMPLVDTFHVTIGAGDTVYTKKDTSLCSNISYVNLFGDIGYQTYSWNTGSASYSTTVNVSGLYWVSEIAGCNFRSDTTNLVFKPLPVVHIGNDTTICAGQQVVLSYPGTRGTLYAWSTGVTDSFIIVGNNGYYSLTVSDNGCIGSAQVMINVLSGPQPIYLGPDTTLCNGEQYVLSTGNDQTIWTPVGSTGSEIIVTQPGTYYASVSNVCSYVSDSVRIKFEDCFILVPNAFTPNNDGLNDLFRVSGLLSHYHGYSLSIFNRWGQRVFYTENIYDGWNGIFNGMAQDIGTYCYLIMYDLSGKWHTLKGDLELIR